MGTIADKLNKLKRTKDNIKAAIISKGVNVADNTPFSSYPNKIAEIETGGIAKPRVTAKYAFHKNSPETNLTQEEIDSYVIEANRMFYNCSNLTSIDSVNGKKLIIANPSNMFNGCSGLTSLDVSKFDTSAATVIDYAFCNCRKLTSLDLSNWDTSNITTMSHMFNGCSSLTSLDLSNWDTSNVTNLEDMFYGCSRLESLNLSNWDTINVTNMAYMFTNCSNLTSLNLSNWDTSKVIHMGCMFQNCSNLTSLDLSNWDTSNVQATSYIFYGCSKLLKLRIPDFEIDLSNIFNSYCSKCNDFQFVNGGTFGNKSTSSSLTLSLDYIWRGSADAIATGHDKTNGYFYEAFANSIGENTSGRTRIIKLYTTLYNSLTNEQKALLTDKGYTLSYGTS